MSQDGITVIDHVFVDPEDGAFLQSQWELSLWNTGAKRLTASKLVDALRSIRISSNPIVKRQVVQLVQEIGHLRERIRTAEAELNEIVFRLYNVTAQERAMLLAG